MYVTGAICGVLFGETVATLQPSFFKRKSTSLALNFIFLALFLSIGFHFDKQFFRVIKGLFTLTDIESYDTEI